MIFYYKYYIEIKNRFSLLLTCWLFTLTTCYFYKETLLFILINSSSYTEQYFIFTDISEIFYVYLQLTVFVSNQVTLLMLLYHNIIFLSSGLYKSEYEKLQFAFKVYIFSWAVFFFIFHKRISLGERKLKWTFRRKKKTICMLVSLVTKHFNCLCTEGLLCIKNPSTILHLKEFFEKNFSTNFSARLWRCSSLFQWCTVV